MFDELKYEKLFKGNTQEGLGQYNWHEAGRAFQTNFGKIAVDPRDNEYCLAGNNVLNEKTTIGCYDYVVEYLPEPGRYAIITDVGNGWWLWDGKVYDWFTTDPKFGAKEIKKVCDN